MRNLVFLAVAVGFLATACSAADPIGDTLDRGDEETTTNKKKDAKANGEETTLPSTPAPPAAAPAPTPAADLTKDGIKNADETDIDCGGAKAAGCADGKTCSVAGDCVNNTCTGGTCKAPAVATHHCQDLSASGCCNTLASTIEKFACLGIQVAGKEIACQGELVLCGIGGIGGTPCGNLNKCCDQMQAEGYGGDAADCRGHNTGNASVCSSWLSQYKAMAWCD